MSALMRKIEEDSWKELRKAKKVIQSPTLWFHAYLSLPHLGMRAEKPILVEGIRHNIMTTVPQKLGLSLEPMTDTTSIPPIHRMRFDFDRRWPIVRSKGFEENPEETELVGWVLEYEFAAIE